MALFHSSFSQLQFSNDCNQYTASLWFFPTIGASSTEWSGPDFLIYRIEWTTGGGSRHGSNQMTIRIIHGVDSDACTNSMLVVGSDIPNIIASTVPIASSPGYSHLFNISQEKRRQNYVTLMHGWASDLINHFKVWSSTAIFKPT